GAGRHEQRPARLGQAERGVAALFLAQVGLGLDDARRQPVPLVIMTDDLAQQANRQLAAVTLEEPTWQRVRSLMERISRRHISDDSRFALSILWRDRYNAGL